MYLTLLLFNAVVTAIYLVLSSKAMKEKGLSPNLTIAAVHLPAAAFLLVPTLLSLGSFLPMITALALVWMLITSALKLLSKELAFYAYSRTDVANVTVFSAFIPIFGIIFGMIMLDERMSGLELTGTAIICVSVYLLYLRRKEGQTLGQSLLTPIMSLRSLPIAAAFLSTLPIALSSVYMKKSATVMSHLHFAFSSTLLIGLAALLIELRRSRSRGVSVGWEKVPFKNLALIGAVFATAQYSYVVLITMERVAHTVAFQPIGIVFQMILAYFILKERKTPLRRLAYGLCIVLGCVLLELGRGNAFNVSYEKPIFWTPETVRADKEMDPDHKQIMDILYRRFLKGKTGNNPFEGAKRCAIVGNSGNLKGSGYGPQIDAHDTVLRMNDAPTAGYEADVGSKTTIILANSNKMPAIISEAVHYITYCDQLPEAMGTLAKFYTGDKSMFRFKSFNILTNRFFFSLVPYSKSKPSTGIAAVFLGLEYCEEVDVYGFGKNRKGEWDHYYTDDMWNPNNFHSVNTEEETLTKLERSKRIRLFKGTR